MFDIEAGGPGVPDNAGSKCGSPGPTGTGLVSIANLRLIPRYCSDKRPEAGIPGGMGLRRSWDGTDGVITITEKTREYLEKNVV